MPPMTMSHLPHQIYTGVSPVVSPTLMLLDVGCFLFHFRTGIKYVTKLLFIVAIIKMRALQGSE